MLDCHDQVLLALQVTVWAGVFPIVVSWWAAVALTAFIVAQTLVTSFCRNRKHLKPLWFNSVSNNILWFTFVKVSLPVQLTILCFTSFHYTVQIQYGCADCFSDRLVHSKSCCARLVLLILLMSYWAIAS